MFCPNCAAKNEGDVIFCRGCGQDLSLVARSLTGHSSIVLISKLDKLFDRPNEILLRDGILWVFVGLTSFIVNFLQFIIDRPAGFGMINFIVTLFCLSRGSWDLILYRHSLTLKTQKSPAGSDSETEPESVFCPACGKADELWMDYCPHCGNDLAIAREIVTGQKLNRFTRFLKRHFGWLARDINDSTLAALSERTTFKNGVVGFLLGGILFLGWGIADFAYFSKSVYLLIYDLVVGLSFLIISWWNYVKGKRTGFEETASPRGFNVFHEFYLDVLRILFNARWKVLKVLLILVGILDLGVFIYTAINYDIGWAFNVAFYTLLAALLFLIFFPLYFFPLFLWFLPVGIFLYFPSFLYLQETEDNQRTEKKKFILPVLFILVLFSLIFPFFASENFSTFAGVFLIVAVTTALIRFLQFLMLQTGLIEAVVEKNKETLPEANETAAVTGGSGLTGLGLIEYERPEKPSKPQTVVSDAQTKRQLPPVKAEDEISRFKKAETRRDLQQVKNPETAETKKLEGGD